MTRPTKTRTSKANPYARKHDPAAYKSGLEDVIAEQIRKAGLEVAYETLVLRYTVPESKHKYTPDFLLPNGIIVESKGRWVTADRKKMKLVKEQYPELDIRMVFDRSSTKIGKKSSTTYGDYCKKLGIPYADKLIPEAWLKEPPRGQT